MGGGGPRGPAWADRAEARRQPTRPGPAPSAPCKRRRPEKLTVAPVGQDIPGSWPCAFPSFCLHQLLDLRTGRWLPPGTAPNIPTPRAGAAVVALGDLVLIAGGEGAGTAYAVVQALSRDRAGEWRWATLPPLGESRHGGGGLACGGIAYVASGGGLQGYNALRRSIEALTEDGEPPAPCTGTEVPPGVDDPAPSPAACFPADATVVTRGRGVQLLGGVRLGEALRVVSIGGVASWAPLMGWSHADPAAAGVEVVALTLAPVGGKGEGGGRTLRLTPGHLLPVGVPPRLVPAAAVAVGDTAYAVDDAVSAGGLPTVTDSANSTSAALTCGASALRPATVVATVRTTARGLYNPHVATGGVLLVVDGVAAADTTTALPPTVAAAALGLARAAWAAGLGDLTGGGLAGVGGGWAGGMRGVVDWVGGWWASAAV